MENNVIAPIVPEVNVAPQKSGSPLVKILVLIIILLVTILIGVIASTPTPTPAVVQTPVVTIEPTPAPTSSASATPITNPVITPVPTVAPKVNTNPNLKTFTSVALKISFDYLETQPDYPKEKASVSVSGNKIYVFMGGKPEAGQSVEIFQKIKTESVAQAIKRMFLQGIAEKDCFVKETTDSKKYPQNFTTWVIAYPVDPNSDIPQFAQENNCPQGYTQTNGIAYFLGDISHPEQFVFLSIGQYGIYADTGKMWQETIKFL